MKTSPMAGKSWQTSHEPPRSKRNRHSSHCRNSRKEGGKGGGRRTAWAISCHTMKRKGTPPVRTPRYAMLQSTSTWNSDTCAYVSTPLTSRGTQALFVVNSVKLHSTAFNTFNRTEIYKQGPTLQNKRARSCSRSKQL